MIFGTFVLALATSFAAVVKADYYIEPDSVPLATREYWCTQALTSCPFLCEQTKPGTTKVNTCDPETLQYGCLCGDNKQPNVSEYSLTIPYFVCQEWGTQCVAKCSTNTCKAACREEHPCGALDPTPANLTSSTTTTASATASSTTNANQIYGSPNKSNDKGAASALALGSRYGLGVVLGSFFLGFALL
ncbi:unnamed protein product [Clonostachys rhizophaga]|uniref:DUF7707 domain-containing protein n=1 Tax=Clonostachys rhizophaga TaxID=160324 RepID=A0A9N9YBD7_9HYPO|nr:unnamed protein product [Clonostachys rhizophaga]